MSYVVDLQQFFRLTHCYLQFAQYYRILYLRYGLLLIAEPSMTIPLVIVHIIVSRKILVMPLKAVCRRIHFVCTFEDHIFIVYSSLR